MDGMAERLMTAPRPSDVLPVKALLMGYCLGCANIIPGVSGGTFLLVFKIYERVFDIVSRINRPNLERLLVLSAGLLFRSGRKERLGALSAFLKTNDFIFLMQLMAGALAAILSLSRLMEYLIVHHFSMTYALFFGLILVSILVPLKMIRNPRAVLVFFILAGVLSTIYVTWAVNPADKVIRKSAMVEASMAGQTEGRSGTGGTSSLSGRYSATDYLYAAACGAAAVSAMVLPGISGSLVLILMGLYFEVVSAISRLAGFQLESILFLSAFGLGMGFGGLLFARLVSAVLKRYYDATMAFLTGLMAGSLYALWPYKKSIVLTEQFIREGGAVKVMENVRVYTNVNLIPELNSNLIPVLAAFAAGCLVMAFSLKKQIRK